MTWQAECWRDLDGIRAQLGADIRATRVRGRVPGPVRAVWWVALAGASAAWGDPATIPVVAVAFEALVAPRLARRPPRPVGQLGPWTPPPSWRPSPEALAPFPGRRR